MVYISPDSTEQSKRRVPPSGRPGSSVPTAALSRHEALTLGEFGIDYIAFGRGGGEALDDLAAMIDWWSALIEIPCAAHIPANTTESTYRTLAAAGADFLIPGPEIWDDPQIIRERLERLAFYCGAGDVQAHL